MRKWAQELKLGAHPGDEWQQRAEQTEIFHNYKFLHFLHLNGYDVAVVASELVIDGKVNAVVTKMYLRGVGLVLHFVGTPNLKSFLYTLTLTSPTLPFPVDSLLEDLQELHADSLQTGGTVTDATEGMAASRSNSSRTEITSTARCSIIQKPTVTLDGVHRAPPNSIVGVRFSPDGKYVIANSIGWAARIWDTIAWQLCDPAPNNLQVSKLDWYVKEAKFSPDGNALATVGGETGDKIGIWRPNGNAFSLVTDLSGRGQLRDWIDVLWSRDGSTLLTGGERTLAAFSSSGLVGTIGSSKDNYVEFLSCVAISPDGRFVATISGSGGPQPSETRIWRLPKGEVVATLANPDGHTFDRSPDTLSFSPDGKLLAANYYIDSVDSLKCVVLWDTLTWRMSARLENTEATILSSEGKLNFVHRLFSPDSEVVVTTGGSGDVHVIALWQTSTGKLIRKFPTFGVESVAITDDGKRLITGGGSGTIRNNQKYNVNVWEITTGHLRFRLSEEGITAMAASADGRLIATGHLDNRLRIWDTMTAIAGIAEPEIPTERP